jgi:hypothetical protein
MASDQRLSGGRFLGSEESWPYVYQFSVNFKRKVFASVFPVRQ